MLVSLRPLEEVDGGRRLCVVAVGFLFKKREEKREKKVDSELHSSLVYMHVQEDLYHE